MPDDWHGEHDSVATDPTESARQTQGVETTFILSPVRDDIRKQAAYNAADFGI